jgi:DNA-binding NarL/FixJ family response regulator
VTTASFIPDAGPAERPRVLLAGEFFVAGSLGDRCELLAEAERLHPDVMVLDITMSHLDGMEAARQLKRAGCRVKLVFLTGHEGPDYVRITLCAGRTAHVVKACLDSDLMTTIIKASEHRFVSEENFKNQSNSPSL